MSLMHHRGATLAALILCLLAAAPASGRQLKDIQMRGVIELCAAPNALPFATKHGEPRGIQIDLAQAIADRLGVALKIAWVTQASQYRTVNCDIVMDMILAQLVRDESNLRPSVPYQRSGVALAVRPSLDGVAGFADLPRDAPVAVQAGSLVQAVLGQRGLKIRPFSFEDEMVEAVAKGDVDAAAVTPTSIGWYNHRHPDGKVRLVHAYEGEEQLSWELAVGMRRADSYLRRELDNALRAMLRDGTVSRIYASYGIEHRPPEERAPPQAGQGGTVGTPHP